MRYRSPKVCCLGGWSPLLPTRFLVSRGTLDHSHLALPFVYRSVTFYGLPFQVVRLGLASLMLVLNPRVDIRRATVDFRSYFRFYRRSKVENRMSIRVWALPCSLAATEGISFDYSSSGYLDVSVHRVCLPFGWYDMTRTGLPHLEIHGSKPTCGSP